eukprot:6599452-Pyramimonas_sp.AAC.1
MSRVIRIGSDSGSGRVIVGVNVKNRMIRKVPVRNATYLVRLGLHNHLTASSLGCRPRNQGLGAA